MSIGSVAHRIVQAYRRARLRVLGVDLGANCHLGRGVCLRRLFSRGSRGQISLGAECDLRDYVVMETWGGRIQLGHNVFIGPHVVIYGHAGVEIGNDTLISMHCRVLSSNHTVPAAGTLIRSQPDLLLPTKIGRDVWLGAGVTILGGVTIGDGCVVGAGAVVTGDLPPNSLALGVPARVTRSRES